MSTCCNAVQMGHAQHLKPLSAHLAVLAACQTNLTHKALCRLRAWPSLLRTMIAFYKEQLWRIIQSLDRPI